MKYKAEATLGRKIIYEKVYNNLSHPNQVVRNVANKLKNSYAEYVLYVMNEYGEVWAFHVALCKDGKVHAHKIGVKTPNLSREDMALLFTGNKSIGAVV